MSEFTLPSGRVVETHEPTFGEEISVVSNARDSIEDLIYAKFAAIIPGLSREDVQGLDRKDGHALLGEVTRIWDGRPEKEDLPLSSTGQPESTDSNPEILTLKHSVA